MNSRRKIQGNDALVRLAVLLLLYLGNAPTSTQSAIAQSANSSEDGQSAQANSASTSAGLITGKVTIKGKGASDITVLLRADDSPANEPPIRKVTTDQEGNYQITNVPAGAYQVTPMVPTFAVSSSPSWLRGKSLLLAERETVQNVDFALTRGGVITGKVTDSEGRPLIEESINLTLVAENDKGRLGQSGQTRGSYTDDRGIYRIFGVPKGKYLVSAGRRQGGFFAGASRHSEYRQTFHPAVTDAAKATIIEVSEGSEATNVDITVTNGPTNDTFSISGRIVDGATGQPLPNVVLGLQTNVSSMTTSITSVDWGSNQSGEFKFQNLIPGKYSIYVESQMNSEVRAEPIAVEIINQDVNGLVMKTLRSASISGVMAFENADAKSPLAKPNQLQLQTFVLTEAKDGSTRAVSVNPDASFRVRGLPAGRAFFLITANDGMGFRVMRVEREGVVQYRGMEIKDGEAVTGVRLVVRSGSSIVRGVVRAEGGELPLPPRLSVWLSVPGEEGINPFAAMSEPQVDSRGHFIIEKLPAGNYEVNASVFTSRGRVSTKQPVNITDGSVTEVTLTLNLKPDSAP
jgi:protocatechuate 3,4-dioxygenase beta subunit